MNLLLASIEIIRPLNVILSLTAVIISSYLVNAMNSPLLPHVCLVVICFGSASNILNDVLDIHIDAINRPDRVLTSGRLRIWDAIILMSILYAAGIIASTYLLPLGRYISLMLVFPLLVLYTPVFKKLPLIGNMVVGSILGLVFLFMIVYVIKNLQSKHRFIKSINEIINSLLSIKKKSIYGHRFSG